jgi:hypothetical protein
MFQVTDLHLENLIVHKHLPYLIDLESAFTGIMPKPSYTGLNSAYKIFKVPVLQRTVKEREEGGVYEYRHPPKELPTKNRLFGKQISSKENLLMPTDGDRRTLSTAFKDTVEKIIIPNYQAYELWLKAAKNVVTRLLPFPTSELLTMLHDFNAQYEPSAVKCSAEIDDRLRAKGNQYSAAWGNNFYASVYIQDPKISDALGLNLVYGTRVPRTEYLLAPTYAFWLDPQTAEDFKAGDVPAYYQRMSTPNALDSHGRNIKINYCIGIQRTAPEHKQPVANALVNLWGTIPPLLPDTYFTGPVFEIQSAYLTAMRLNEDFAKSRIDAAIDDLENW